MISFITMSETPHSHDVVRSKEELLEAISKLYDLSVKNGCTHFDVVVDTDGKKEN